MQTRAVARRVIRPVVGQDAWFFLRDVDHALRQARRARAGRPDGTLDRGPAAPVKVGSANPRPKPKRKSLTDLAQQFHTDKWGNHYYTPHYEKHLQHLRDRPIRLLEIGIGGYNRPGQGGASLRMWKAFFPKATIVGLDIEDKSHVAEDRIRIYQGDQSDPQTLNRISAECGPFDVIIDDGSHRVWHVLASFEILFPLLKDDGIYVVEDIQSSYWPEWGGSDRLDDPATSMGLLKSLCDGLNHVEYVDESYEPSYTDRHVTSVSFYHNLVFVQKGENREGTKRRQILADRYVAASGAGSSD